MRNWGQTFPVYSSLAIHQVFFVWLSFPLSLTFWHCRFGCCYISTYPREQMICRNVSFLQDTDGQWYVALIKVGEGRRAFWEMSERCQGVLHRYFSSILPLVLSFFCLFSLLHCFSKSLCHKDSLLLF